MSDPVNNSTSLTDLVVSIIAEARALLRTELMLAKAELSENASRAGGGVVLFAIAALIALVGLNALAVAAVFGVAALGVGYGWAALIVAVGFLGLAAIFALVGKSRLSVTSLTPKRTLKQIKTDVHTVKEMARV